MYKQKLDFYFKANNIACDANDVSNDCRKYIFLTVCGDTTFSIVDSFLKPDTLEADSYEDIIKKLDEYFSPSPNPIMEWYQFNKCDQHPNELLARLHCRIAAAEW